MHRIYRLEKSILDRYIDYVLTVKSMHRDTIYHRLCSFFEVDEHGAIFDYVICRIMKEKEYPEYELQKLMSCLITPVNGKQDLLQKQDAWIRDFMIKNIKNCAEIKCLFAAISYLDNQRKKDYLLLFIENNTDYGIFEQLQLLPTNYSYSGSEVPILSGFIDYLNTLLPHLGGVDYLKHKDRVEKIIERCHVEIEAEEIRESLRN